MIPQFYFVYKRDPLEIEANNIKDTYQYYWVGMHQQYSEKKLESFFKYCKPTRIFI